MHNVLIEMLLLTGIPGLTLYLCLILMVLKGAFQLFFAADTPIYLKFLAVIPPLLMVNGFTEIYPTLSGNGRRRGLCGGKKGRRQAVRTGRMSGAPSLSFWGLYTNLTL